MIITINKNRFVNEFADMNRADHFSIEGRGMLFDYFEEVAPEMELDIIAICCDYVEQSFEDIASDYSIDLSDCGDDCIETVLDYLTQNTCIVGLVEGGAIYSAF
jgi:hypothetical protein